MVTTVSSSKIDLYIQDTARPTSKNSWTKKLTPLFQKILPTVEMFIWAHGPKLRISKIESLELSMTMCGAQKIKTLNRNYRNKDKVTDVLSFPIHDSLRFDSSVNQALGPVINCGDIFICKEVAKRQALAFGISIQDEVIHLFIHGLLHLLGFDHEGPSVEKKVMMSLEEEIIQKISVGGK
ncbi:MAG: rRNA maturation RNase YbeY [Bacteriovoracaceae bacterium]|nr:rRNA maturation RNase YbeY [Bacteriovoracaceae bacterium]